MGGAPTRQNIKSHLQKYRLMMVKRSRQPFSPTGAPTGNPAPSCISTFVSDDVPPAAAAGAASANEAHTRGTEQERGDTLARSSDDGAEPAEQKTQSPIDQDVLKEHLARQETNLKVQMDLQTKLHRQLLVQRQLQHQLEHSFSSPDPAAPEEWEGDVDPQHRQGMLKLKNSLRERLTKHVVIQQEMLQHLDALVSSEVSKPTAPSYCAERAEAYDGANACRDSTEPKQLQPSRATT